MNRDEVIGKILTQSRTIAVVGLSSSKSRPGYYVPAYLQGNGYRIIPVNPYIQESLGEQAYPRLEDVPDQVDLVLIFRQSDAVYPFVEQAIKIGAKGVWMQLGIINVPAADLAEAAGLDVVTDACMMVEHRRWQPNHLQS